MTSAARIGSRYAIVHGTACTVTGCPATSASIQTYVLTKVTGLDPTQLSIKTTYSTAPGCTDATFEGPLCTATVTATYGFKFVLGYNRAINMSSTSQMIISQ